MPSEVDAAYAVPDAIVRVRSSDRTVRFVTRNWRVESSPRRYKPSTIEMRSAAAMRQTGAAAPSLAVRSTSICQVRTLPRVPASTKTSSRIRKPPAEVSRTSRSRSRTTARVTPETNSPAAKGSTALRSTPWARRSKNRA